MNEHRNTCHAINSRNQHIDMLKPVQVHMRIASFSSETVKRAFDSSIGASQLQSCSFSHIDRSARSQPGCCSKNQDLSESIQQAQMSNAMDTGVKSHLFAVRDRGLEIPRWHNLKLTHNAMPRIGLNQVP